MSFGTTPPRADYTGTGSTASYSYGWRIFKATDLLLTAVDTVGVETLLTYLTDYTVANVGNFNGGTITILRASLLDGSGFFKSGYGLTIRFGGNTEQDFDLRNQGGLFPERIEDAIDRLGRFVQKLEDVVKRSFHLPETEVGTDAKTRMPAMASRISAYFAWDASGNPIATTGTSETPNVLLKSGGNLTGGVNEARGNITQHATTMDLFAVTSPNILDGTGSAVTITAIVNAPQAGARRTLYPIAGTTITNGATFAVDGAANYTTAAGDKLEFEAVTASTFKVHIIRKNGKAIVPEAGIRTATVGGTANALTASFSPALDLTTAPAIALEVLDMNTSTVPTLAVDGGAALTIMKRGGYALAPGDIVGVRCAILLKYNVTYSRWELLNPQAGVLTTVGTTNTAGAGGTLAANTKYTQAHGLSGTPTLLRGYLECTTVDLGFAVGQRVDISMFGASASGVQCIVASSDSTNTYLNINGTPTLPNFNTFGSLTGITLSSWKVIIVPSLVT